MWTPFGRIDGGRIFKPASGQLPTELDRTIQRSHVSPAMRRAMTGRLMVPALSLGLLLLLACCLDASEAAKAKKKSSKSKGKAKGQGADAMRCGVCIATVDEIQYELSTTENSTSTLDMRWGLTSEVTEGRAKRIGKVIPYKRSELRSIEVMEKVCEAMRNYGIDETMPGETQLRRTNKRPDEARNMQVLNNLKISSDDQKKFERFCEELVEQNEQAIIEGIRDSLETHELEDLLCFGKDRACGELRTACPIGSYSARNGTAPCTACEKNKFQDKEGQTSCVDCPANYNTSGLGSNSSESCVGLCKPGEFSSEGLAPCHQCGNGMYQPKYGQQMCEKCPDGKGTRAQGTANLEECVSVCGDRMQSKEEQCDDGNTISGDGCDQNCNIEPGHLCLGTMGATHTCNKVVCGDMRLQTSSDQKVVERCDDGNTEKGDGCSSECTIEAGYACAMMGDGSFCRQSVCGDGIRQHSDDGAHMETCDDGNTEAGDGCSPTCEVEPLHVCEGEYMAQYTCHRITCGDGNREGSGGVSEQCDDGNTKDGDGCSSHCRIEDTHECDDGSARRNVVGPPGFFSQEKSVCTAKPVCGDGIKEKDRGETCDDGNSVSGDGCSSTCTVEPGFACWADRNPSEGPVPGPDDIVPDTCKLVSAQSRNNEEGEGEVPGVGRKKPAVHRMEL